MTLTEYYYVHNKRALHDADTNFRLQRLIANLTQGAIRYVDGDMQVYHGQEWVSVRSITGEIENDVNQILSIRS